MNVSIVFVLTAVWSPINTTVQSSKCLILSEKLIFAGSIITIASKFVEERINITTIAAANVLI